MSSALCFVPLSYFNSTTTPRLIGGNPNAPKVILVNNFTNHKSKSERFQALEVKAANDDTKTSTKTNTLVCSDCDGNGAIQCKQCKGEGVNSQDHFDGRFKAGGLCWLCRGKKEILCGGCNGAGFKGGFISNGED